MNTPDPDWIDITRPLRPGMVHWPGDRGFELERVARITGPGTSNLSELHTSVHIGTHVDAPLHFIENGQDVGSIPLHKLCGPATVVAVDPALRGDFGADDERYHVIEADLAEAKIPPGDRVLIRTPNADRWSEPAFDPNFHALAPCAARWLVAHEAPLVGVDYLSVDPFTSQSFPVHDILLRAGVVVVEGVDLRAVAPGRYELIALPLPLAHAEGSPARVIIRPWTP